MDSRDITKEKNMAASQKVKEREYWLNLFSDEWQKTTFPYDNSKTGDTDFYKQISFCLEGETFHALSTLSNNSDRRLFMVLLAQLTLLLYKYAGSTDTIIGMPIYKQEREGEFVNTMLALRNSFSSKNTFKELLLNTRKVITEAVEHQNYPIETLVYKLGLPMSETRFPLFDMVILLENIHDRHYLGNIKPNMLFIFNNTGNDVTAQLEYNAALFSELFIQGLIAHFKYLGQQLLNVLDTPLSEIDILSEAEQKMLLFDFNRMIQDFGETKTIARLFEEQVERTPDKIAVIDQDSAGKPLTYKELNQEANRIAHWLKGKGVGPDNVVGLLMEATVHRLSVILGILKAGGAYLPIDPEFPMQRIASILSTTKVMILLCDEEILSRYPFTFLSGIVDTHIAPIRTEPRAQITQLDDMPLIDRTLIDYSRYHHYIGEAMAKHKVTLQAARGCPYNCVFCHKIWPKTHVRRSAENLFQEVSNCYQAGIRRFAFIDDIFNLDVENSSAFFRKLIQHKMDVQMFFCNGLRADILTKDYIDLMVEAGTVNIDVALESGSPRIQKLIRKNLNLDKFHENVNYITSTYPQVILEMELMIGFPSETEEEAMMTLDFLKQLKWVHFPNLHILKIYPTSDVAELARVHGIKEDLIRRSTHLALHELPDTLPYSKSFAREFQARMMNEYFLMKERMLDTVKQQIKVLTPGEMVDKYDSYLPFDIKSFQDILDCGNITLEELGNPQLLPEDYLAVPDFNEKIKTYFPGSEKNPDAFKVLLLDVSMEFSHKKDHLIHTQNDEPLGLMYLQSYLDKTYASRVRGKILKAGSEFDNFEQLQIIIEEYQPHLIGIRSLSFYSEFFHETVSFIRQIGITVPIISGGPYATSDYNTILQDPQIDLVVLGEGEYTFAQLVGHMLQNQYQLPPDDILKTIDGLAFLPREDRAILLASHRQVLPLNRLKQHVAEYSLENPEGIGQPSDLLYMISTSGSTGTPKSVMIENRNFTNLLYHQFRLSPIDFSGNVLQFASIGFDVSVQEIFSTLLAGGRLHLIHKDTKSDIQQLFQWIQTNQIDILFLPPSYLKHIFSEPEYAGQMPTCVKHIIAAGEQLVVNSAFKSYLKNNNVFLHNHYGPSETHVVTTLTLQPADDIPTFPSIGKPIVNTQIYILNVDLKPVPVNVPGELYIGGANVGRGYFDSPELTSERFVSLPNSHLSSPSYRTGDLARWLPDGNIKFLGRIDAQVKIRGFRIEPGEIETRLMEMEDIKEAVVIDRVDDNCEKYLCAYVISATEEKVDIEDLRERLGKVLPDYMVPAYIMQIKKIPLSLNGKVKRDALPSIEDAVTTRAYVAPRDEWEKRLCQLWAQVLGIDEERLGIDDNFFELGGHSLKATILIAKIHKVMDIKLILGQLFSQPTVRGLAEILRHSGKNDYKTIQSAEPREFYPLSSSQRRMYLLHQLDKKSLSYNMPSPLLVEGDLDKNKVEAVLWKIIQRQEALRTRFIVVEGEPRQQIVEPGDIRFSLQTNQCQDSSISIEEVLRDETQCFVRPFDLSSAPLFRAKLVELTRNKYLFMIDLHHIVCDGMSLAIMVREFIQLYQGEALQPLPLHYRDYTVWQQQLVKTGVLKQQERYWIDQLTGVPPLELPLDFTRPSERMLTGSWKYFDISKEITVRLKKLAEQQDVTLYMVVLAVYNILLYKYTGQETIVVGSAIAGRSHPDLHDIMGVFLNTLAMKNQLSGKLRFNQFLKQVKETTLKAYENQDYQFEDIVEKLHIRRDSGRSPIFDTMLNFVNVDIPQVEVENIKMTSLPLEIDAIKFDLKLNVRDIDDMLKCSLEYSSSLFKHQNMATLIDNFLAIFDKIIVNTDILIADIPLLSSDVEHRIIEDFNQEISVEF